MSCKVSRATMIALIAAFATLLAVSVAEAAALQSVADSIPQKKDASYDKLVAAANAVVGVKVKALPNARSNSTLGEERVGSGVVIGKDGLVLTIGYLVVEADSVSITDTDGSEVPARVLAYDHATGFGLVKPLAKLPLAPVPIRLGTAKPVAQLDRMMIVTGGEEQNISIATVVSKREYAGYWEYMIEDAIFTAPARFDHSGAALINKDGELIGIGSLFVMDALTPGERLPGNMFVPVDLLKPILDEMVRTGSQPLAHRPWLGVNSLEEDGRIKVMQVNDESPADKAGIAAGDIILRVNGDSVANLEDFYKHVWTGTPGTEYRITVLHGTDVREVLVRSMDRKEYVRRKPTV